MRLPYFKNLLQNQRHDIEGRCGICHDDLVPEEGNTTYCKGCGQNLHYHCIEKCVPKRCPYCREMWSSNPQTVDCPKLEADGFNVYFTWLNQGSIPSYKADEDDLDERTTRLLKAWRVATQLDDNEFRDVILKHIGEDYKNNDEIPGIGPTKYIFKDLDLEKDPDCWRMRLFFVDLFLLKSKTHREAWYNGPVPELWMVEFLSAMTQVLMGEKEDLEDHEDEYVTDADIDNIVGKYQFEKSGSRDQAI